MTIAMTGATGLLGRLVARELLQVNRGGGRTILSVRDPNAETLEPFARAGAEIRRGDYDDPESLRTAFQGASKLLLISSSHADDEVRYNQHKAAIDAAKEAGVRHLVYTSFAYAEKGRLPLHRMHLRTEKAIQVSGMAYTVLRNASYTDVLRFLGLREALASGVLLSPPGTWTFNAASRSDLAEAAAVALTEEGHENRIYELTAARAWTLADLAKALAKVSGRPVERRSDPAQAQPIYRLFPLSENRKVSSDLENLLGRPPRSLEEEVREFLGLKR